MSSLYQRNGIWQIQFEWQGKQVQKSLRTTSLAEAKRVQKAIDKQNAVADAGPVVRVDDLAAAYEAWAKGYYRKNGELTSQFGIVAQVVKALKLDVPITEFGPKALQGVMEAWVGQGVKRTTVNKYVQVAKQIFKWGAAQELYPVAVYQALATVPGLRAGRCSAEEPDPVVPVPDAHIEKVGLSPELRDMVNLQLVTGARPGEILKLRPCDIDRAGPVWLAEIKDHKTAHRGKGRTLYFGPRGQAILRPYLLNRGPADRLFGYTPASYRRAVARACERAKVPQWSPNQLRHNAATTLRREFGLDAAQVILGHSTADTTQIYADLDRAKAMEIVSRMG